VVRSVGLSPRAVAAGGRYTTRFNVTYNDVCLEVAIAFANGRKNLLTFVHDASAFVWYFRVGGGKEPPLSPPFASHTTVKRGQLSHSLASIGNNDSGRYGCVILVGWAAHHFVVEWLYDLFVECHIARHRSKFYWTQRFGHICCVLDGFLSHRHRPRTIIQLACEMPQQKTS
jgi:hypothetical protein